MTDIEIKQEFLYFFIKQEEDFDNQTLIGLDLKHPKRFLEIKKEFLSRHFIKYSPNGGFLIIADEGKDFYNDGGFPKEHERKIEKAKIEEQLKKHQLNAVKPYRFWLPFCVGGIALILNFSQMYKTTTIEKELQKSNLQIDSLRHISDSHTTQLQTIHHKVFQKDS